MRVRYLRRFRQCWLVQIRFTVQVSSPFCAGGNLGCTTVLFGSDPSTCMNDETHVRSLRRALSTLAHATRLRWPSAAVTSNREKERPLHGWLAAHEMVPAYGAFALLVLP